MVVDERIVIGAKNSDPIDQTITFKIRVPTLPPTFSWWEVALVLLATLGGGASAYALSSKKKRVGGTSYG